MRKDVSGWMTRVSDEMVSRYTASGKWAGVTLLDHARRCAEEQPDALAVVDGSLRLSFKQIFEQARSLATALRSRGLKLGDVLSYQLPNWHEAMVINLAATMGGFVCNPIVPIYRDAEVEFILKNSRTKAFFIPSSFRSIDYVALSERLRPRLPELQHVVVVRPQQVAENTFSHWLEETADPLESFPPVDPNAVKLLLYTSGTTGDPKGVLHSHNTLGAEVNANIGFWGFTSKDVCLMPSPVTHITGYLYALELPFAAGMAVVLMDRWQAAEAVDAIAQNGVTFSVGATPFLVELVGEVEAQARRLPSLRCYVSGGAPVPPEVVRRARIVLPQTLVCRAYGMSEAPTISLGVAQSDPPELGATTDGLVCNHEVRIVDAVTGKSLQIGEDGEILTKGPEVMLGYTNPAFTEEAFDKDGFFHTGDLGFLNERGYITINGRKKDLIIRGGENISPKEIEDVLHRHPAVQEAAVVAMPHERMGETPCAYIVLKPQSKLDFESLKNFLEEHKLARQKFPERLVVVDELPHNAAGKVLKQALRERCANEVKQSA